MALLLAVICYFQIYIYPETDLLIITTTIFTKHAGQLRLDGQINVIYLGMAR